MLKKFKHFVNIQKDEAAYNQFSVGEIAMQHFTVFSMPNR